MRVTPHPARALMSRSALVNLFQPLGCPEVRSMEQVPSSNFSKGEEVTEIPDVRTSRKSAPFQVGSLRNCGPIRPVTGRPSSSDLVYPLLRPPPLRSGYHRGGEHRAYPV